MDFFNNAYPGLGSGSGFDPYTPGYNMNPNSSSETDLFLPRRAHSDEDVLLASSRPKKRAGRVVFKETRHPVYRGVRRRNNDKWVCEVREPSTQARIWLGSYPTAEMAARAHDVAALALRGRGACLNFADSAWRLPMPASTDPVEIRRAATEAANMFLPQGLDGSGSAGGGGEVEAAIVGQETGEEELSGDVAAAGSEWAGGGGFGMEGWLEGPLLSPPHSSTRFHMNWDDVDSTADADVSLWSFSV